jgi:hypothetical protein
VLEQYETHSTTENYQFNHLKNKFDELVEKMFIFQKDIAMKASLKEVLDLVDSKNNQLFESVNSTYDQFLVFRDSQNDLNQKLCANNCVARWLFKFDFSNKIKIGNFEIYDL